MTGVQCRVMNPSEAIAGCRTEPGTLYVVATPIGHLADLSSRAVAILGQVDLIAAEDTRVSRRLLTDRQQPVEMVSVNEHSEWDRVSQLIERLQAGQTVALVSDAGTPLISDPGFRLVCAAHDAGITVSPVPGPCAAIAALSVAGLPTDRFWFEGFLPARSGPRRSRLESLQDQALSLVFYVPARDLVLILNDMVEIFGADRRACLTRELTKLHETVRRDKLSELAAWVSADANQARGEAVLMIAGKTEQDPPISQAALTRELTAALPPSKAAAILARLTGLTRKEAWSRIHPNQPTKEPKNQKTKKPTNEPPC